MSRSVYLDLRGYKIVEYSKFSKDLKKLNKSFPLATKEVDRFKDFMLSKGSKHGKLLKYDLRYTFNLYDQEIPVYYSRWAISENRGKSSGARIWFACNKNDLIVLLLTIYTHQQGIADIKRNEAQSLLRKAINELS